MLKKTSLRESDADGTGPSPKRRGADADPDRPVTVPADRDGPDVDDPRPPRWRPSTLLRASVALHVAAATAWPLLPRRGRRWLLGALAVDHLLLGTAGTLPGAALLGPVVTRLPPPRAARGEVALTFDDGPDPAVTPRLLELLAERDAGASFFVVGRRAARHPELVAEIARRGHRIENHTWRHPNAFAFYGPRAQGREIDRTQRLVAHLAGRRPTFFRAPAGIRNPFLDPLLARRGLRLAAWTRRGYDTVDPRPERVLHRLLQGLRAGDVLLLHDGNAARDRRGRPVVLEVLPRLLDALAERGLRPAAL